MESPPPFSKPGKKNSTGLIIGLVIGGVVLCCILPLGGIAGAGFWGFNKAKGMITCAMAFKQVRNGVNAYAADHNGKLPNAKTWMDDVRPYFKKEVAKEKENPFGSMPAEGAWGCTSDGTETGMAFNSALSGKNLKDIKDKVSTIVVFEVSKRAENLAMPYKEQPRESSPKMFNKPRGWLTAPLEGKTKSGNKDIDVSGDGSSINID